MNAEGTVLTGVCLSRGVPHFQVLSKRYPSEGGTPVPVRGYPNPSWGYPREDMGLGYPQLVLDYSPAGTGLPSPFLETEQQSEYLLRGGRYASCGHAGLSCLNKFFLFLISRKENLEFKKYILKIFISF